MNRKLGSVISTVALLTIAVAAAAVNVRILHTNRGDTSVLSVQPAADVTSMDVVQSAAVDATVPMTSTEPAVASDPTATAVDPAADETPVTTAVAPKPAPKSAGNGKLALGRVTGGGDDDDEDYEEGDHEDGDGRFDDGGMHPRREFIPLTPAQRALLRVSALARVTPQMARDAAKGTGSAEVIARVQAAAQQIGVPLSDLAAITSLPPERGRGHGGNDGEHEGDDDD